ncbi:MAG: preprotein translocase subunit SecG [candidate division Zixibacteria bacterium]|nr:preprotein translocase subunit SecG [candidate division Zixibacteria bacterium]
MFGLMLTLHVIICVALIITILLQSSKGEGLAGAFGGSGITGAVFGGRGAATFLSKATTVLAIAFFVSSLGLSFLVSSTRRVVPEGAIQKQAREERAQPGSGPATNVPGTDEEQGTKTPVFPEEGK